jgi:uncharacterized protein (TIGR03790 family)
MRRAILVASVCFLTACLNVDKTRMTTNPLAQGEDAELEATKELNLASTPQPGPAVADFNCDHRVDLADYTVWRDNLGSRSGLGDADGDGQVTAADYTVWKQSYGTKTVPASTTPQSSALLVVNTNSPNSVAIANWYRCLRPFATNNVLNIAWTYSTTHVTAAVFKQHLLQPIKNAITSRGLTNKIFYIIYSSDFPTMIDGTNYSGIGAGYRPQRAINGLTYFMEQFLAGTSFTNWLPNIAQKYFTENGRMMPFAGTANNSRYYISTMLGVTSGRLPNTLTEVQSYLCRLWLAEKFRMPGKFYFMTGGGARTETREGYFPDIVSKINSVGFGLQAQSLAIPTHGAVPKNTQNILGLNTGAATVNMASSNSSFAPSAIVDNMTSFGGMFWNNGGQTLISEFFRYGAAAASGTVAEPTNNPIGFPTATTMWLYTRGANIGEAFYYTVGSPGMLLIVGDPLARPYHYTAAAAASVSQSDASGLEFETPTRRGRYTPPPRRQVYRPMSRPVREPRSPLRERFRN